MKILKPLIPTAIALLGVGSFTYGIYYKHIPNRPWFIIAGVGLIICAFTIVPKLTDRFIGSRGGNEA